MEGGVFVRDVKTVGVPPPQHSCPWNIYKSCLGERGTTRVR